MESYREDRAHFNSKLSRAIKDDTAALRADNMTIRDVQSEQQNQALLQWLSATDYPAQQHDIISQKQEDTAKWFLESPEMKRWLAEMQKTLFCPGIPGAGKTMMAAVAIDYLQSTQPAHVGVAYVFCSYKRHTEQNTPDLIAALMKQLLQARPDLLDPVKELQNRCRGSKASLDQLCNTLQSVCAAHQTVYIVVDALDEYANGDSHCIPFIEALEQLQVTTDVRLLFTSRFLPTITEHFECSLNLEVRASEEDVRRFVTSQLPHLPMCIRRNAELQNNITSTILRATDGM